MPGLSAAAPSFCASGNIAPLLLVEVRAASTIQDDAGLCGQLQELFSDRSRHLEDSHAPPLLPFFFKAANTMAIGTDTVKHGSHGSCLKRLSKRGSTLTASTF